MTKFIITSFIITITLTACGSYQPPGEDIWIGVKHVQDMEKNKK